MQCSCAVGAQHMRLLFLNSAKFYACIYNHMTYTFPTPPPQVFWGMCDKVQNGDGLLKKIQVSVCVAIS